MKIFFLIIFLTGTAQAEVDWSAIEKKYQPHLDVIQNIYGPIAQLDGHELKVKTPYNSNPDYLVFLGASAARVKTELEVNMGPYNFLMKHNSPGVVAMILCHEIGHHYGGYPNIIKFSPKAKMIGDFVAANAKFKEAKKSNDQDAIAQAETEVRKFLERNAKHESAEGQADLFATQVCYKEYLNKFYSPTQLDLKAAKTGPIATSICEKQEFDHNQLSLCKVALSDSVDLVNSLIEHANYSGKQQTPYFTEQNLLLSDKSVVEGESKYWIHPDYQCRLDTLKIGVLCMEPESLGLVNSIENIHDISCKSNPNLTRPKCWYYGKD